jgi:hypothetical protein
MSSPSQNSPSSIPLSVFLLGALWAGVAALVPAATLVISDLLRWVRIDWSSVAYVAGTGALAGVGGYVKKYQALVSLPPWLKEARDLADGARTVTTTVTATVKETHVLPAEPTK